MAVFPALGSLGYPEDAGGVVEKLIAAHAGYHNSRNEYYDEVLHDVEHRIAASGSAGKTDVAALVSWKRLNASAVWVRELMQLPESAVRDATGTAFEAARSTESISEAAAHAVEALHPLPGLRRGGAVASAVLTAGVPERMAVYDRRAHASLRKLGISIGHKAGIYSRYMAVVEALRYDVNSARGLAWRARDVDLALYWMAE